MVRYPYQQLVKENKMTTEVTKEQILNNTSDDDLKTMGHLYVLRELKKLLDEKDAVSFKWPVVKRVVKGRYKKTQQPYVDYLHEKDLIVGEFIKDKIALVTQKLSSKIDFKFEIEKLEYLEGKITIRTNTPYNESSNVLKGVYQQYSTRDDLGRGNR